jgi:hypothetical protein
MPMGYYRNPLLRNTLLPVDIVLHPAWWHRHAGIIFDADFYFHPHKRVEVERQMEQVLYARWGQYGIGQDRDQAIPQIGAVHLAAGFLISEMLGCRLEYPPDAAPQVIPANLETLALDPERAFQSPAFKRLANLAEDLKAHYGYLKGDVNWSGILNIALDLRGQAIFTDMLDQPEAAQAFFRKIAQVIEQFTGGISGLTGTTSIAVNRNVRNIPAPVYLHSECSHTMIGVKTYAQHLLPFDVEWSRQHRPYGIHYCGTDPHRHASAFAQVPHLDFLDLGWGGDVKILRQHLPHTFFNLRLSPVEIVHQSVDDIRATLTRLVHDSGNPWLTGICCINMDQQVGDEKITAIFETVAQLRQEYYPLAETGI